MADITVTAAQIGIVHPESAEVYSFLPSVAVTAGQAVYMLAASGKLALADANATAPAPQFKGIALQSVSAGVAVDVLKRGTLAGFDLSSLNYGAKVYLSDTAGAINDTVSGTTNVPVGQVISLADSEKTKCLYIDAAWATGY